MSRIAPVLHDVVEHGIRHCEVCKGKPHRADGASAELRALLGVVRAAQWWVDADMRFEKGTPAAKLHEAMTRLARLSRASGKRGGR